MSSDGFGTLFEQIFAPSPDVIWIGSASLDQLYFVNRTVESWLPISREALLSDPSVYLSHVHEDDRPDRRAFHEQTIESATLPNPPNVLGDEFRIWDRTHSLRWISEQVYPIATSDGEVRYWAGILRDITEQRDTRDALSVQSEQFKLLNQIIRHDIRNEMNLGLDIIRNASRRMEDPPEAFEQLTGVMERVVDLTETSRDMTAVIGELAGNPERIAMKPCLQREITTASMIDEDARISVDGEIPEVDVYTTGLLSAVFRNVLHNAVQHNDADQPTIEIRCDQLDSMVVVHIADNGPGVPDKDKERIFESGEALSSNGTGFGLALIETLLRYYDGNIFITDNDPRGSLFSITLPLAGEE